MPEPSPHSEGTDPRPCTCGHEKGEHSLLFDNYTGLSVELRTAEMCSGNTWAFPAWAESDRDGRQVRCRCRSYWPAEDDELREWGLDPGEYEPLDSEATHA